jgi:hypothetical protein
MNRITVISGICTLSVVLTACSTNKQPGENSNSATSTPAKVEATPAQPASATGLQPGQASGTYTANGESVELKYAYAGRGERFGTEATIILLTDKPIPAEEVAAEIKTQNLLQSEQVRGLEYVVDKDGLWVRFHPGQYQESISMQLKEYAVEGDIVRGTDENDGKYSNGKYARSVKFVATIVKP